MHLTIQDPFGGEARVVRVRNTHRKTLGELLGDHAARVDRCLIDGLPCINWPQAVLDREQVVLELKVGEPVTIGSITTALIMAAISAAVSIGIGFLMRALADDPAENTGRPEEVFGIAALTNTIALGTPKMLVYGTRRVFGHIIATKTAIGGDGTSTTYGALYFMGEG